MSHFTIPQTPLSPPKTPSQPLDSLVKHPRPPTCPLCHPTHLHAICTMLYVMLSHWSHHTFPIRTPGTKSGHLWASPCLIGISWTVPLWSMHNTHSVTVTCNTTRSLSYSCMTMLALSVSLIVGHPYGPI